MSEVLRKCLVAQQKDNIAHTVVSQPHEVEGMKLPVKVIHWQKKRLIGAKAIINQANYEKNKLHKSTTLSNICRDYHSK